MSVVEKPGSGGLGLCGMHRVRGNIVLQMDGWM